MDAMGCQTEIARLIRKKGAHYILAVKLDQTEIFNAIKATLDKHGGQETGSIVLQTRLRPLCLA